MPRDTAPNVGLGPYRKKPGNPTIFPLRVSGRPSPTIWKNWRQTNLGFTLKMRSAIIRVESSRASRGFFQANISKTMKCRERFMSEVRSLALVTCAVSAALAVPRSEEHTSELQSLMRISYAVFCLKKKKNKQGK